MNAIGRTLDTHTTWLHILAAAVLVIVLGAGSVLALVATDASPLAATMPVLAIAALVTMVKVPLRWSAAAIVFLLLALEISTDAFGIWHTPFVEIGELLTNGFAEKVGLPIAGFELLLPVLLLIEAWRRASGGSVGDSVPTAGLMRGALWVFLAGFAWSWGIGIAKGQGLVIWKVRYLLHIPFFFLFFQIAFRRPADYLPVGIAIVAAAHVKTLIAAWVQLVEAPAQTGGRLAAATNHGDSILFAVAALLLIVHVLERSTWRAAARTLPFLILPLWGMLLNERRLVWAILAMALAIIFLSTSWRPWKTKIVRLAIFTAPLLFAYFTVGWKNTEAGGIFRPLAEVRTMLDGSVDRSTLWRDRETWNITKTIRENSPLGIGYGGAYVEYTFNDDISAMYKEYREWPHNTVLGLLLLTGIPGFAAIWLIHLVTVFLALRAERLAETTEQRIAATACVASVVACLAMAWGDTGAHFLQYKIVAALTMGIAAKLATETGGWPAGGGQPGTKGPAAP